MTSYDVAEQFAIHMRVAPAGYEDPTVEAEIARFVPNFDRAFVAPSLAVAVEASILAARNYWGTQNAWGRYWTVTMRDADHGATGLGLQASDDTYRAHRKLHTGPFAPGFAVTTVDEIMATVGPAMNIAPYQSLDNAPRIPWSEVALVLLKPSLPAAVLDELFILRGKHQFLIGYECEDVRFAPAHTPDLLAWDLGKHIDMDVAALLARGVVADRVANIDMKHVGYFGRFAARLAAMSCVTAPTT